MFKVLVVIYMFLDILHSLWIEDELKKYREEKKENGMHK
jgi:hypothetical protein|nr:MAG TPA: hypothetical protein [Caudoviricetes sp.]